jgi:hypothetical protein
MKFAFDVVNGKEAAKEINAIMGDNLWIEKVEKGGPAAGNDVIKIITTKKDIEFKIECLKKWYGESEMPNEEFIELYAK